MDPGFWVLPPFGSAGCGAEGMCYRGFNVKSPKSDFLKNSFSRNRLAFALKNKKDAQLVQNGAQISFFALSCGGYEMFFKR